MRGAWFHISAAISVSVWPCTLIGQRGHRLVAFGAAGRLEHRFAGIRRLDTKQAGSFRLSRLITEIHQDVGELLGAQLRKLGSFRCGRRLHVGAMVPHRFERARSDRPSAAHCAGRFSSHGNRHSPGFQTLACPGRHRRVSQRSARRRKRPSNPERLLVQLAGCDLAVAHGRPHTGRVIPHGGGERSGSKAAVQHASQVGSRFSSRSIHAMALDAGKRFEQTLAPRRIGR